mgnify:CR=1 FL=1
MSANPYNTDLDRTPANFQPLTPLTFLERAAMVFPDHTAIIHGALRRSYATFYARSRQLASALSQSGIKRGDTVSALLPNTPAMLECHYGVPMCGAVLHSVNTRLDASVIAFQLDHAMSKVVIVDREFMPLVQEALALHASQLRSFPHVRSPENFGALAQLRGAQIGVEFAEAYRALRQVVIPGGASR